MNKSMSSIAILGVALGIAAFPAQAYNTHGRWPTNAFTMRAANTSFPVGNAYRTAIGTVASRWNQNPSNVRITQLYDDASVGFNNGESEVWFSTDASYNPAVTFWWYDAAGGIREADIVFYTGGSYTTSMSKLSLWAYGGAGRPFETTAMHEYGHALGLLHEADEYNIMGQDWTHLSLDGSTARSYSGEDADDGAVFLYGLFASGTAEDMGVVHMKRTGASGEYSSHGLTQMYNSIGVELPFTIFNGQKRYNVSKGYKVQVEFTFENNGESSQTSNIGLYLSTDNLIRTTDTQIQTAPLVLSRIDVLTSKRTVVIPPWLVSG